MRWARRKDPKTTAGKGGASALLAPVAGLAAGLVLLILAVALFFVAQIYGPGPRSSLGQPLTEITFGHGMSVTAMGRELQQQHIIRSAGMFRFVAKLRGHTNGMRAGTYDFPANASLINVLSQIEQGKVVRNVITIPEGRTSAQALRIINATPYLTGDIDQPPEGSILPETYEYQRGETRQAVLDRMLDAGRKTLDQLWAKRAPGLPFANKEEALIMASIVERETGLPSERPRVAAVFINRLKQGVRLGSDPTVIYGISKGEPLGRGLTKTELETRTAWNTYLIDKLPPTPISNPGKAALAATLNPAKTQDLYFVADGSGGHVFAATYEEHLANVARWRQIEGDVSHYASSDMASEAPAADSTAAPAASTKSATVATLASAPAAVRLHGTSR